MSNVSLTGLPSTYIPDTTALDTGGDAGGGSFTDVLKTAVSTVNQLNDGAAAQVTNLVQGGGNGDLNSVMIAVEKADVSFQLMMQVRNKIVSAYQDIEKMQF
jgi:flagellar hook-basal body complex protein FliE